MTEILRTVQRDQKHPPSKRWNAVNALNLHHSEITSLKKQSDDSLMDMLPRRLARKILQELVAIEQKFQRDRFNEDLERFNDLKINKLTRS
jgi:hypothetical protein